MILKKPHQILPLMICGGLVFVTFLAHAAKLEQLQKKIEQNIKGKAELDQQHSLLQTRIREIEYEIAESKKQISQSRRAFYNYLKMKREMMTSSLSLKILMNSTPAQMDRKLKWVALLEESEKEKITELVSAKASLQKLSSELSQRNSQVVASAAENEKQTQLLNEQIRLQSKVLEKLQHKRNVLAERGQFLWPLRGEVTQHFGANYDDVDHLQLMSQGIQISSYDLQVQAAAKGVVRFAETVAGLGQTVIVDHGHGVMTAYAMLEGVRVSPGKQVEQGEGLGRPIIPVGESTAKVYFEIRHYGMPVNPKDWLQPRKIE